MGMDGPMKPKAGSGEPSAFADAFYAIAGTMGCWGLQLLFIALSCTVMWNGGPTRVFRTWTEGLDLRPWLALTLVLGAALWLWIRQSKRAQSESHARWRSVKPPIDPAEDSDEVDKARRRLGLG